MDRRGFLQIPNLGEHPLAMQGKIHTQEGDPENPHQHHERNQPDHSS